MNKFRIYYFEIIVNILFVIFVSFVLWYYVIKINPTELEKIIGVSNSFKIIFLAIFIVLLSTSVCLIFFFFIHLTRLFVLKEKKAFVKRIMHFAIFCLLFGINIVLACFNMNSNGKLLPKINGLAITAYTCIISIIIMLIFYVRLSKNEIYHFKELIRLNRSLVDELHEN